MSTPRKVLRGLPYFADLPDDLLGRVAQASELITVPEGTVIIEEGSDSEEMYVVVSGEFSVTKQSSLKEVELARIGHGEVVGEIALLDQAPRTATVTALADAEVIRVPVDAFEDLLSDPRVVRRMFRMVTSRLRGIEDTLRHEERMAALGRMAAQLMHELNNPASAVSRGTAELKRIQEELDGVIEILSHAYGSQAVLASVEPPDPPWTPLEKATVEEQLSAWLTKVGVEDAWRIAPPLVELGWTAEAMEEAMAATPDEIKGNVVRFMGLTTGSKQVLDELSIGARRIAELVRVVKEYSFLDRGPVQEFDPTDGIRDTLILLKHKLDGIDVELDFEHPVPRLEAPGRELNQVWTNLIDNAADAMADQEEKRLTISSRTEGDRLVISFSDTGPGIPESIAQRIFDPFFTTKEPGHGTGLGLPIVHTILTRLGGSIDLETSSEGTTFHVGLPLRQHP